MLNTKNNFITRVGYLFIICLCLFALSNCSSTDNNNSPNDTSGADQTTNSSITVKVQVLYPEESTLTNLTGEITLPKDATPLDALNALAKNEGAKVSMSNGSSSYVQGVGEIFEKEYGKSTGWAYTVNGESIRKAASEYKLADEDEVIWKFIDFNKR